MTPKLRGISGEKVIKILCNEFGFKISGQKGSHVRLSKMTPEGKVGTVIPLHNDVRIGTLRSCLRLADVDTEEFERFL
jgi:predicted RNA binding protein YcfA (HicA-like mRNA interferase family)